ncbi:PhoX family protein [Paenibacillus mucilaginosus]|uniref:DUF839 domain-containing protein n=1 Tax=Paenibacillus mucilaginosus (strain KNP414) TaxID=1036673 RepID=F8FNG2_PAEMK|nr:alkaline phosphatase PhoX [Paenibacillus mucilaginosus]AEI38999.1 protein of unknown function DUF839 [Paenibacillus mucilaginosus KNP414]MCG7216135.1 DUF839 domain-containing protein [Paenibacillus mucilaginosus]WDM28040.1 DUF839 domain-containing protein [Paenibacillus mucilaginosus]
MSTNKPISRRHFLAYLGTGAATLVTAASGLDSLLTGSGTAKAASSLFDQETPVVTSGSLAGKPVSTDELTLPGGFQYDVIAAYGDVINTKGDTFGYDSASAVFLPENGSRVKGLLYVDHETSSPQWAHGSRSEGVYTAGQINSSLYNQGASVLEVYRGADGRWRMDTASPAARRITGLDPFELTGPARGAAAVRGAVQVQGTLGNRTGAVTLWGTVLTSEGSWDGTCHDAGLDPSHYGWAAEIDPADPAFKLRKHTALGRFRHSGAPMKLTRDGRAAVYMGDTAAESPLFKYISRGRFDENRGTANSDLLTDGALYAADLENGRWIELTVDAVKEVLRSPGLDLPHAVKYTQEQLQALFREQADVLVHAAEAALLLGATPLGRQGDAALHPLDGSLYVSLVDTSVHGQILRIVEEQGDAGASAFEFEITATGGPQSGFTSPGHLAFDRSGRLWIAADVAPDRLLRSAFRRYGSNGLYVLDLKAPAGSGVTPFASAPVGAAFASPAFTPGEQTLFLSVQHPGAASGEGTPQVSSWPHLPGSTAPRSALVAVRG